MKRATLTAYPTALPSAPSDLTDRLLENEDGPSVTAPARRRRKQPRKTKTQPERQPAPVGPPALAQAPSPAVSGLEMALTATDSATEALRQAAREAPARYDVALHYRLDALAHHLQQVREFVANLAAR